MARLLLVVAALAALSACGSREPGAVERGVLGLGIPGAVQVEPELIASGQYDERQFAELPALGYHTVIQLRPANEKGTGWEEAKAGALGLTFIRIPVAGAMDLTESNARKLDEALKGRSGGTLVACSSGNRVGGLFALRAYYCEGRPAEEALQAGRAAGLGKAEPAVRKVLGLPAAK
jgi:uncharacterized protein (TIGR01244 family)